MKNNLTDDLVIPAEKLIQVLNEPEYRSKNHLLCWLGFHIWGEWHRSAEMACVHVTSNVTRWSKDGVEKFTRTHKGVLTPDILYGEVRECKRCHKREHSPEVTE